MSGFKECMDRAVAGGEMDAGRAEQAKNAYDLYAKDMAPADAQARVVQEAGQVATAQRRRMESNARAQQRIKARIEADLPLSSLVESFSHKGSLRMRHEANRAQLRGRMSAVLKEFKSDTLGRRRNKATLENLARERYNQKTGDHSASELAQAFTEAQKLAKELYEAAGGFVRTKSNFGLPQSHSQVRVGKTPAEDWVDEVLTMIDKRQLTDDLGNVLPEAAARDALLSMHEHISADGWVSRDKSQIGGAYKLGERKVDPDFLPFKDGDAWLRYAEKFGEQTDPFRVMVGYIDSMAHQISEAEILGVDADASWQYARDLFLEKNKGSVTANSKAIFADAMRDNWSGVVQTPQNRSWARGFSTVRQYLASVQLGSAFISSISDLGVSRAAAAFTGMSKTGHLDFYSKLLRSKEFRDSAREMGLILENAVDMGTAAYRYSMEDFTSEFASRLSDFTMRTSLLSGHTQIMRDAVGMSAMNDLAKMRGKKFSELDDATARTFEGFEITSDVWDKIRTAEVSETKGVEFLRPKEIEAVAGRDAALSVMEFVQALQNRSVLTSSIQSQAVVRGTQKAGSVPGEFLRTVGQYKTFPIEFLLRPISQIMTELSNKRYSSAMEQGAIIFVGMTLLGAAALQMKEQTKGRKAKDMDSLDFWKAAALQGGGVGIFGDFLFADHNRFGRSIEENVAGPTVSLAGDALKLTVGNISEVATGEDTNFGKELVKFGTDYTPAQSLWYARLAFERLVEDNLMRLVDPEAQNRFNNKIRKSEREANGYWWRPGEARPE